MKSSNSNKFYFGWTIDLRKRLQDHNQGLNRSAKYSIPWALVFYAAFETENLAKDFELYLKSGSGKSYAYKRLVK